MYRWPKRHQIHRFGPAFVVLPSISLQVSPYRVFHSLQPIVRLESGEVGTELRNTLGGGKTQESRNAEGAGKRKCGRSGNVEMQKERKCGKRGKAEKRNVIG